MLDDSHQIRTRDVGVDDEIRGIHFECLAVGLVVDVLVSATKCGRIACRKEEVQVLGRCGSEIDESKKETSLTRCPAWGGNHTHLGFFFP